jgi:hypothetical protein
MKRIRLIGGGIRAEQAELTGAAGKLASEEPAIASLLAIRAAPTKLIQSDEVETLLCNPDFNYNILARFIGVFLRRLHPGSLCDTFESQFVICFIRIFQHGCWLPEHY